MYRLITTSIAFKQAIRYSLDGVFVATIFFLCCVF